MTLRFFPPPPGLHFRSRQVGRNLTSQFVKFRVGVKAGDFYQLVAPLIPRSRVNLRGGHCDPDLFLIRGQPDHLHTFSMPDGTMTRRLFKERYAADLERANRSVAYVGDSPNDASMFAFFANSVGVANIARFADRMSEPPKFVTQASAGAGFAELVAHLLR